VVHQLAGDLFGRHIGRRADHFAARTVGVVLPVGVGLIKFRQPEIEDLDVTSGRKMIFSA